MRDHEPDLPIRTARTVLRRPTLEDVPALAAYRSMPEVCRYLPFDPQTEDDLADLVRGRWASIALGQDDSVARLVIDHGGTVVGDMTVMTGSRAESLAEIGWIVSPRHRGRGYATEAARALLPMIFDRLGAHRLIARLDPANTASAAVAARIGMRRESLSLEDAWLKGEWADTLVYAMLEREYRALPPAAGGASA